MFGKSWNNGALHLYEIFFDSAQSVISALSRVNNSFCLKSKPTKNRECQCQQSLELTIHDGSSLNESYHTNHSIEADTQTPIIFQHKES